MRTSVLPEGATLEGEIRGTGDLVVRGTVLGALDVDGSITVDATGRVRGEIRARSMVVRGEVEGPVNVVELLRLDAGGKVVGDVVADRVSAATGALLRGRVRMTGAERLKRTAGGTLTAPFTSSGMIEAPSEMPRALPIEVLASAGASIRERVTEVPHDHTRQMRRDRLTDKAEGTGAGELRAPIPPIRVAVTLPAPEAPEARPLEVRPEPLETKHAKPPPPPRTGPPVVPRLGRVRSRGRS